MTTSASSLPTFTQKETAYFRKMFNLFDTDKSGSIGYYEMKNLSKHLGVEVSDDVLRQSMDLIDINQNRELDFNEFLQWIQCTQKNGEDPFATLKAKIKAQGIKHINNDQIEKLKEAFESFDIDHNGRIDMEELTKVFEAMGQEISKEELQDMIAHIDDDGNQEIDFEEFTLLMCSTFGNYRSFEEEMLEEFYKRDVKHTGLITMSNLRNMIAELTGTHLSTEEIDQILQSANDRGDGTVEYMKWESLWEACRSK